MIRLGSLSVGNNNIQKDGSSLTMYFLKNMKIKL